MVLSTSAFAITNNPDFIKAQKSETKVALSEKLPEGTIARGFKLGLGASSLHMEVDSNGGSDSGELDTGSQLTLGYNRITTNKLGFNAEIVFLDATIEDESSDFRIIDDNLRISVNATYGFNEKFYGFAGINTSSFSDKTYSLGTAVLRIEHDSGAGFQVGTGYKVNHKLGLELSYIEMNSSAIISGVDFYDSNDNYVSETAELDFKTSGVQLNLTGTF